MANLDQSFEDVSDDELNLVMSPDRSQLSPQPTLSDSNRAQERKEKRISAPAALASTSLTLKTSDILNTKSSPTTGLKVRRQLRERPVGRPRKRVVGRPRKKADNGENDTPPGSGQMRSSPRDSLPSVAGDSRVVEELIDVDQSPEENVRSKSEARFRSPATPAPQNVNVPRGRGRPRKIVLPTNIRNSSLDSKIRIPPKIDPPMQLRRPTSSTHALASPVKRRLRSSSVGVKSQDSFSTRTRTSLPSPQPQLQKSEPLLIKRAIGRPRKSQPEARETSTPSQIALKTSSQVVPVKANESADELEVRQPVFDAQNLLESSSIKRSIGRPRKTCGTSTPSLVVLNSLKTPTEVVPVEADEPVDVPEVTQPVFDAQDLIESPTVKRSIGRPRKSQPQSDVHETSTPCHTVVNSLKKSAEVVTVETDEAIDVPEVTQPVFDAQDLLESSTIKRSIGRPRKSQPQPDVHETSTPSPIVLNSLKTSAEVVPVEANDPADEPGVTQPVFDAKVLLEPPMIKRSIGRPRKSQPPPEVHEISTQSPIASTSLRPSIEIVPVKVDESAGEFEPEVTQPAFDAQDLLAPSRLCMFGSLRASDVDRPSSNQMELRDEKAVSVSPTIIDIRNEISADSASKRSRGRTGMFMEEQVEHQSKEAQANSEDHTEGRVLRKRSPRLRDSDNKLKASDSNLDESMNGETTDIDALSSSSSPEKKNASLTIERKGENVTPININPEIESTLRRSLRGSSTLESSRATVKRPRVVTPQPDTLAPKKAKRSTRSYSPAQKERETKFLSILRKREKKEDSVKKEEQAKQPILRSLVEEKNPSSDNKYALVTRKRKREPSGEAQEPLKKVEQETPPAKAQEQSGLLSQKKLTAFTLMKRKDAANRRKQAMQRVMVRRLEYNERRRIRRAAERKQREEESAKTVDKLVPKEEPKVADTVKVDEKKVIVPKIKRRRLTEEEKRDIRNARRRRRRAEMKSLQLEKLEFVQARMEANRLRAIEYRKRKKAEKLGQPQQQTEAMKRLLRDDTESIDEDIDLSDEDLPLATLHHHIKNPLQVPETPRHREMLENDLIPDFQFRRPSDEEYLDRDEILPITPEDLELRDPKVRDRSLEFDSDSDAPLLFQVKKKSPAQFKVHNSRKGRGKPRVTGATPEVRMEKIANELERTLERFSMLCEEARSLFPELTDENDVTRRVKEMIRDGPGRK